MANLRNQLRLAMSTSDERVNKLFDTIVLECQTAASAGSSSLTLTNIGNLLDMHGIPLMGHLPYLKKLKMRFELEEIECQVSEHSFIQIVWE